MLNISNNAESFSVGVTAIGDLTITVDDVSVFPPVGSGDYFYMTIYDALTFEIVRVNDEGGGIFTIVRAQEGTTAQAWPDGTLLSQRITAATVLEAPIDRHALIGGDDTQDFLVGDNAGSSPNFAIRFIQVVRNFGDQTITGAKTWAANALFNAQIIQAPAQTFRQRGGGVDGSGGTHTQSTGPGGPTTFTKYTAPDIPLVYMTVNLNGTVVHATVHTFSGGITSDNDVKTIFKSSTGNIGGLGSKQLFNDATNTFHIQRHDGANWQSAIVIASDGTVVLHDSVGLPAASVHNVGPATISDLTIITREKGDARYMNITGDIEETINGVKTFSGGINLDNNIPLIFRNVLGDSEGLSANRMLNDGGNALRIQHHNGTEWRESIGINPDGTVILHDNLGNLAAIVELVGTAAPNPFTIITREKGDARYMNITGDIEETINGVKTFSGGITSDNDVKTIFKNTSGSDNGLGAKQFFNDAGNVFRMHHHNGVEFQNSFIINANGRLAFYGADGISSAFIENLGTDVPNGVSVITREKGDFRYIQASTNLEQRVVDLEAQVLALLNP